MPLSQLLRPCPRLKPVDELAEELASGVDEETSAARVRVLVDAEADEDEEDGDKEVDKLVEEAPGS